MEEKKNLKAAPEKEETKKKALDLDDLEDVAGGSLRNVKFTKTKDISDGTKNKI